MGDPAGCFVPTNEENAYRGGWPNRRKNCNHSHYPGRRDPAGWSGKRLCKICLNPAPGISASAKLAVAKTKATNRAGAARFDFILNHYLPPTVSGRRPLQGKFMADCKRRDETVVRFSVNLGARAGPIFCACGESYQRDMGNLASRISVFTRTGLPAAAHA